MVGETGSVLRGLNGVAVRKIGKPKQELIAVLPPLVKKNHVTSFHRAKDLIYVCVYVLLLCET